MPDTSTNALNQHYNSPARTIIRWGLYPLSWLVVLAAFYAIFVAEIDARTAWGVAIGFLGILYLILEFRFPYEKRWAMTWKSFLSDLKYVVLNGLFISLLNAGLAIFAITMAGRNDGIASDWPIWVQVPLALLIFEAINYSMHRFMHEGPGRAGDLAWRLHAVHHLPPRLYLAMHAVFHPINGIIIQALAIVLPIYLMGYSDIAVMVFMILNGMHGLLSHFSVDVRMGWANYLFVGPEVHRYHHSANMDEAVNYGNTLVLYDILFGTFIYRPAVPPKDLGVAPEAGLPPYERIGQVLMLPFRRA